MHLIICSVPLVSEAGRSRAPWTTPMASPRRPLYFNLVKQGRTSEISRWWPPDRRSVSIALQVDLLANSAKTEGSEPDRKAGNWGYHDRKSRSSACTHVGYCLRIASAALSSINLIRMKYAFEYGVWTSVHAPMLVGNSGSQIQFLLVVPFVSVRSQGPEIRFLPIAPRHSILHSIDPTRLQTRITQIRFCLQPHRRKPKEG